MKFIKNQIIYWIPVYILMIIIFYFSSQSHTIIDGTDANIFFIAFDIEHIISYLLHIVEYSILGGFVFRGFFHSKFKKNSKFLSITLAGLYGVSDEIHQYFIPGRFFSFLDMGFDILGVVVGIVIISLFYRRFYK